MILKRRVPQTLAERFRTALWPTVSFRRSFRYMTLRLWRIPGSSHSIALGCAAGVFAIFTPFLGFQMILAALIAWCFGGNVLASAVGTFAGNPLTYPVIWVSTFTLGNFFVGGSANAEIEHFSQGAKALGRSLREASPDGVATAVQGLWPVLKPMALGSLPLGGCAAVLIYIAMRRFLDLKREREMIDQGLSALLLPVRSKRFAK
jgi:uncharacterized protein (DUF2062 family)